MSGAKRRSHSGATSRQLAHSERLFLKVFRADAIAEQGRKCHYCREWVTPESVTADHALAKSNGGTTQRKNIKAACGHCNGAKGAMSEGQFQDMLHSPNPPREHIPRLRAWIRFRMERQLQKSLRHIAKAVGLPK
jgi:5-methylcytosine-specific restriction endonuclease McrA